jgi:hypothetical protein
VVDTSSSASRPNGTSTGVSFGDGFANWSKNEPRPSFPLSGVDFAD